MVLIYTKKNVTAKKGLKCKILREFQFNASGYDSKEQKQLTLLCATLKCACH